MSMEIEMNVINSNMINDEDNIYFPFQYHGMSEVNFGLARFPCNGDLKDDIIRGKRELEKVGQMPRFVFVPFKRYHEEVCRDLSSFETHILWWLTNWHMKLFVMTPDYLKDRVTL